MIELTKSKNIDLGLVIDLTFTDRYYNRKNFTDQGVAYEKIFVPGHVIPDDEIVNRWVFFDFSLTVKAGAHECVIRTDQP